MGQQADVEFCARRPELEPGYPYTKAGVEKGKPKVEPRSMAEPPKAEPRS